MNGDPKLYQLLDELHIPYEYLEHPPAPTIEIAKQYWAGHDAKHCKNLFFRNHKGNQHYLVCLDCDQDMNIHDIEKQLHQGKLSFASEQRLMKYLGVKPGSHQRYGTPRAPLFRQATAECRARELPPMREYCLAHRETRRFRTFPAIYGQSLRVDRFVLKKFFNKLQPFHFFASYMQKNN